MFAPATLCRWTLVSAVICCFAGCGDGGNPISGTVNFNGKPVPSGKIYFIPDESKGNVGAPGYATIENGAYDTSAAGGKSPQLGPMTVGIEGFDPNATATTPGDTSGEVTVKALFPYYQTTTDLTADSSTVDFDVPASAATRKDVPDRPMITP
jgi:hypothetical protein